MNGIEQLLSVWKALAANKMRSFLTLLGVIMGVGTIVLLSSLMAGGLAAINHTVAEASGDDMLQVRVNTWEDRFRNAKPLDTGDMRALARANGLEHALVVPELERRSDAKAHGKEMRVWFVGTNERALDFYQLELARGRFLTTRDRLDGRPVAVVGQDVAKTFFPDGALGELRLEGQRYRVVGVLSRKPSINSGNRSWNNSVAVPDSTYLADSSESRIGTILVKTNELTDLARKLPLANQSIRSVLSARQHDPASLDVSDSTQKDGTERGFLAALNILLWAVAILCLGVGGINIMNIMLVTVTERTREIGLRMAIGARQRDILRQFLFEAAALSALGGLLGIAGGVVLGWGISLALTAWLGYWPYMLDPLAVAVAFGSALATGLAFGYYPAKHAASLAPIECLRYE